MIRTTLLGALGFAVAVAVFSVFYALFGDKGVAYFILGLFLGLACWCFGKALESTSWFGRDDGP